VVGWLCCAPLAPVPLGTKPKAIIGRSSDCDLVLRHPSVSRHHCTITARDGGLTMLDEGSSNGTFLNGKRVSQSNLVSGDMLSIGCFEVEFRSNDAMLESEEDMDMEGTRVVNLSSVITHLLHEISLMETLQGLEFNRRSGTLRILSGQLRGTMVVSQGRPLWATLGAKTGDEAVLGMLELTEGRVTISQDLEPGPTTMHSTITGLLLEASRRIDEGNGHGSDVDTHDEGSDIETRATMQLKRPGTSEGL
jgi:pSer/pThr/pTyr-binding forkhead associated (FHA) protein